jgi:flavin-dependent dehydrogenase
MRVRRAVDVVVVGGGPAGAAAAVTAAVGGADVAVVVGPRRRAHVPGQSAPPGTDRVVHALFGHDAFDERAHLRSFGNRSAWGSDDLLLTDFMFNPFGTGWHLDRDAFDARLLQVAAAAGADVLRDTTVESSAYDGTWTLVLRDDRGGSTLRAGAVCDASGRRAAVARAHGARVVRGDRLVAVASVAHRLPDDDDHTSTVEAVADGWWYTAPCPDGSRAFLFVTDPETLHRAVTTRAGFARHVAAAPHVGRRFAATATAGASEPVVVPAGTRRLASPVGCGWVAAGDAAVTFDPLSSQGILTALLLGRDAGRAVLDPSFDHRARWEQVVRDYARERSHWYAAERRFTASRFWARRHAALAA